MPWTSRDRELDQYVTEGFRANYYADRLQLVLTN